MKYLLALLFAVSITGCTDAMVGKYQALGDTARVTCYSAEKIIFDDCSTGKVQSEKSSDGYFFISQTTGRPVEISGNCVIAYNEACPIAPVTGPGK